jgi:hypothetical protein
MSELDACSIADAVASGWAAEGVFARLGASWVVLTHMLKVAQLMHVNIAIEPQNEQIGTAAQAGGWLEVVTIS